MKKQKECWLKQEDIKTLYEAVRPNTLSIAQFTDALVDSQLAANYKLPDLKKIQMELCDILNRCSHLREANDLKRLTKKDLLGETISLLAVKGPPRPSQPANEAPAAAAAPLAPAPLQAAAPAHAVGHLTSLRPSDFSKLLPRSTVPLMGVPTRGVLQQIPLDMSAASKPAAPAASEFESPLSPIVATILRLQVRLGSTSHTFEMPRQYAAGLAARTVRVQLVPVNGIATPAAWPKVKEIFVFVNGRPVLTPWKRCWPQRRVEVAKGYLPLDISPLLDKEGIQKMQIDCFARDYCGALVMQLVSVVSEPDAVTALQAKYTASPSALLDYYGSFSRHDSDEVQCCDAVVSTKCPILQSRISVPMRGANCRHLQCFDAGAFLRSCHIGCFWNCPVCDAAIVPSRDIVVDGLFQAALQKYPSARYFLLDSSNLQWVATEGEASGHIDVSDEDDGSQNPARKKSRNEKPTGVRGTADDPICL